MGLEIVIFEVLLLVGLVAFAFYQIACGLNKEEKLMAYTPFNEATFQGKYMLRNIPPRKWKEVRQACLDEGVEPQDWVWQAILAKLSKEEEGDIVR